LNNYKKNQAFQEGFVDLRRVTSHITTCREDYAPGEGGLPSVEFSIDEISQPDEAQTYRESGTDKIRDLPEIPLASPAEEQSRKHDADKSSVE
jgi:hypothetical protein